MRALHEEVLADFAYKEKHLINNFIHFIPETNKQEKEKESGKVRIYLCALSSSIELKLCPIQDSGIVEILGKPRSVRAKAKIVRRDVHCGREERRVYRNV